MAEVIVVHKETGERRAIDPSFLNEAAADDFFPEQPGSAPQQPMNSSTTRKPQITLDDPDVRENLLKNQMARMKNPMAEQGRELNKGFARGASYGVSDPLLQGGEAISDYMRAEPSQRDLLQMFLQRRKDERARTARGKGAGMNIGAAEAFGSVAPTVVFPGTAPGATTNIPGIMKPAWKGLLRGGAHGFAGGVGMSNADVMRGNPEDIAQAGTDGLQTMALSAPFGALSGIGSKTLSGATPRAMADMGESRATKAIVGQNKAAFKKLVNAGKVDLDGGADIGRFALDNGVVQFGDNVEEIANRAKPMLDETGRKIGMVGDTIDRLHPGQFNQSNVARELTGRARNIPPVNANQSSRMNLLNEAEGYSERAALGGDENTFKQGLFLKRGHKYTPGAEEGRAGSETARTVENMKKNAVAKELYRVAKDAEGQMGSSLQKERELIGSYPKLNKDYGYLADIEDFSRNRAVGNASNRFISPTSQMLGGAAGAGAQVNNNGFTAILIGAAVAAANQLGLQRGNAAAAVGLDKTSKFIFRNMNRFGPYAGTLVDIARGANVPLGLAHYILAERDPNYRDLAATMIQEK